MSDILKQLLLQLLLIALNAFFAAAEIAVISLNEKKVRAQAEDGDKKATKMLKILEDPTKFLSTIQVGITLAGFLGSAFAADNFAARLTGWLVKTFEIAPNKVETINTVSVIIITVILSYFTLILGELVPKRIAMKHKEKFANSVCGFIAFLNSLLRPIVWFLTISTNGVLRLCRIDPNEKEEAVSEEDIVIMLDAGADEGTLKQDDIEYIKNVFKLERLSAADIMTPRNAMVAIPKDIADEELIKLIEEEGYSRIPVYGDSVDNVIGILPIREFLLKHNREGFSLEDVLMPPEFVPETVHLDALFKDMQNSHTHMVVVLNEYGLTLGVVTMEDILEELVGEIWDEQDEAVEPIIKLADDCYRVLSGISIDEFFEYFELDKNEEIESTTVNGWITEQCGSIPEVEYTFDYERLNIRVTEADEQRTHEVLVTVLPEPEEESEDENNENEEG
jgi:putative hemolysin